MTIFERKAIYTKECEEDLIHTGNEWNFHEEITKEYLHGLHPYPAKFIPQIPRKAILEWTKPGDTVYDPFNGCGTTVLEASLMGRHAIGTDNNAVAILASRAKTASYTKEDIGLLKKFNESLSVKMSGSEIRQDLIPQNERIKYWFDTEILEQLSKLKGLILDTSNPIQTLLMAIFSSIIVRVSYQDSDTRYSRKIKDISVLEVEKVFKSKLASTIDVLVESDSKKRGSVRLECADSRSVNFIENSTISLIVTSPPYLNAYDYHKYHRQRLHWIGGDDVVELARKKEIGSHDEFTKPRAIPDKYFEDMNTCFNEWYRVLKSGGKCIIVVGDAIVSKAPVYVGDTFVEMMKELGFILISRSIRTLHSTKRAFNVKNSRMTHEHVLIFEKP